MSEKSSLFLLVVYLLLSAPLFGQSNYGVITGTVADAQHLPIAGAAVQLTAASTGTVRRVVTNQEGLFEAPALLPDDYTLKTEANGFAGAKQSVRLEVGQKLGVTIILAVGSVKEGVKVTAGSEVLHTTDASVGEVVEPQSVRELPLNGRMLIDLVLTVPTWVSARKRERRTRSTGGRGSGPRWSLAAPARTAIFFCWTAPPIRIPHSTRRI